MSDKEIDVQDDIIDLLGNKNLTIEDIEDIIEEAHGSAYRSKVREVIDESL